MNRPSLTEGVIRRGGDPLRRNSGESQQARPRTPTSTIPPYSPQRSIDDQKESYSVYGAAGGSSAGASAGTNSVNSAAPSSTTGASTVTDITTNVSSGNVTGSRHYASSFRNFQNHQHVQSQVSNRSMHNSAPTVESRHQQNVQSQVSYRSMHNSAPTVESRNHQSLQSQVSYRSMHNSAPTVESRNHPSVQSQVSYRSMHNSAPTVESRNHQSVQSQVSYRSMHNSTSTVETSNREADPAQVFRHVDDDCNTPDYEVNIFFQLCEVILQPETATSKEITRWGNIRRWFIDHPSRNERYAACVQQGVFSTTPLHIVCQHSNCPLDIVDAMLECTVETASWEDTNGWLPLHYACAKSVPVDVIMALMVAYPDGEVTQDKRLRTPLHFAFFKSGNDNVENKNDSHSNSGNSVESNHRLDYEDVGRIVSLLKRATMIGDEKGRLPLHFAAAYGTSQAALEALIDACPRSLCAKENTGRTALHYTMANAHNDTSPCVLGCLLKHMHNTSIDDEDEDGNLPLHLMSLRAEGVNAELKGGKKAQENVIACLKLYLDAGPKLSADILTALQTLPGWLRDNAVTHPHVQKILNKRIAERFPIFALLLDGYFYILIIVCFSFASRSHIHFRFSGEDLPYYADGALLACFFGATYFLIRAVIQVVSMISLSTFRSWFLHFGNWLDIIVISLVYHYCVSMARREKELRGMIAFGTPDFGSHGDESFRTGVAFTIGALWLIVINFLKSTMLEFSVFYETVLSVSKNLFIFMISLAVILIAFAQMFLIVFRKTPVCSESCISDYGGFPHCSFDKSILKVYTMMLGEIGEVNRYQQSITAQILYVAFVFLVVILLSNVLIAIVTDSHSVVKNERAEVVFWSNRLDFVAEMDTIEAMRKRVVSCVLRNDYSDQAQAHDLQRQTLSDSFREWWNHLVAFLKEKNSDDISLLEYYLFLFLRIITILLVIPLWFAFGLCTAGFLWPPQIREWFFVMRKGDRKVTVMANEIILEIKNTEREVKTMTSDILREIKRSNNEQHEVRNEMNQVKSRFVKDLSEIKRLALDMKDFAIEKRTTRRRPTITLPAVLPIDKEIPWIGDKID